MNGFAIATLLIAGVVSGCKIMDVKRGEKVVLVENKFGSENISRVALYNASKDCSQKGEISKHCSSKEKESGCTNKNDSTFSFDIGKDSVSLTPLNASDGFYVVSIIDVWSKVEKILIVVNGELPRTVIPDPPSQENPEANSTKGTETPGTDDLSTLGFTRGVAVGIAVGNAVGIAVGIAVGNAVGNTMGITVGNTVGNAVGNTMGITVGNTVGNAVGNAVGIAVGIAVWCCLKKKKNNESEASDCKKDPKKMSLIEAGEQTTGDSLEVVDEDRIPHSEDDNLKEVLIVDDTSVEHGRPGHNYSDDDDCKHNNTKNYCDSNFCSNDEDDDVILSNNTNNYVNNNNNSNDDVANGKNDDDDNDDGISTGDNSSNGINDYL